MKRLFFILILLGTLNSVFAQAQAFDNRSRSIYILDIAKSIKWSETSSPFDFRVAILDKDTTLYKHMQREAKKMGELHGKTINIMHYTSIDDISLVDVIFFERKNRFSIDKVFQKVAGKKVLLITEGYQFHKSMINFIVINGFKRYEVNEAKIKAAGLKIDKRLLVSNVKSEADWSNLYEQSLLDLADYKRMVEKQRALIRKQKAAIADQLDKIAKQEADIESKLAKLDTLTTDIAAQQKRLAQSKRELKQEKERLRLQEEATEKQSEILKQQEELIATQQKALEEQKDKLDLQTNKLNEDLKIIEDQENSSHKSIAQLEDKLNNTKTIFYSILSALSLLIAVLIFRSWKLKTRTTS